MTEGDKILALMKKAKETMDGAKLLLSGGHMDACVSRSYYSMFYAAEALLLTKGLQFRKHSGVIAAYNREFVNAGIMPQQTRTWLQKGFDYRMQGDYDIVPVEKSRAEAILNSAEEFRVIIESYLKKEGYVDAEK